MRYFFAMLGERRRDGERRVEWHDERCDGHAVVLEVRRAAADPKRRGCRLPGR